jgi:hypothetical protein
MNQYTITEMTIAEKLDQFIEHEGKGCVRDALNVALSRLDQKKAELHQLREEVENLKADLEMVGSGF